MISPLSIAYSSHKPIYFSGYLFGVENNTILKKFSRSVNISKKLSQWKRTDIPSFSFQGRRSFSSDTKFIRVVACRLQPYAKNMKESENKGEETHSTDNFVNRRHLFSGTAFLTVAFLSPTVALSEEQVIGTIVVPTTEGEKVLEVITSNTPTSEVSPSPGANRPLGLSAPSPDSLPVPSEAKPEAKPEIDENGKEKVKLKPKGFSSRIRELEETRKKLQEKESELLLKQEALLNQEQTVQVLEEQLMLERRLRELLTKEKKSAEEEAALAIGLCSNMFGGI